MSRRDAFKTLLKLDEQWGAASAGLYIPSRKTVVTGHESGYVVTHRLEPFAQKEILRCPGGRITSVVMSSGSQVVVGSQTGGLYRFDLDNLGPVEEIISRTDSKGTRIWTVAKGPDEDVFIGMTYGTLRRITRREGIWSFIGMPGHSDSIFGLDSTQDQHLASGDWSGRIILWNVGTESEQNETLRMPGCIEDLCWYEDKALAAITTEGTVLYFESDAENKGPSLKLIYEVNLATGQGRCVTFTQDGRTILAGTKSDLIQFDLSTTMAKTTQGMYCVDLWAHGQSLYILTRDSLLEGEIGKVEVPIEHVRFKHAKISLLGHTATGKSTLSSLLSTGAPSQLESTFGKRTWVWTLEPEDGIERRITIHDHGGQRTVMSTFIPFLFDSDIILVLFKQTDRETFEVALRTLKELEERITEHKRILFVQTFIDNRLDEARADRTLEELKEQGRIYDYVQVCPLTGENIDELRNMIAQAINWESVGVTIQLESTDRVREVVQEMIHNGMPRTNIDGIVAWYHKKYGVSVSKHHVGFVMSGLSREGVVEYYPDLSDFVIMNDDEFNTARSEVPIAAREAGGIVTMSQLRDKARVSGEHLAILVESYTKSGFCVTQKDLLIFPELLSDEMFRVPDEIKTAIQLNKIEEEWTVSPRRHAHSLIIDNLLDLNLTCINASKSGGLFSWKDNGILYYVLENMPDSLTGERVRVRWTIGGRKIESCRKLAVEFERILSTLFGDPLDSAVYQLIRNGENEHVEFKSSLRWDFQLNQENPKLEYVAAATIAAFMNTEGGNLFLGVDDSGSPIGLAYDYRTMPEESQNRDGYAKRITDLVRTFLGTRCLALLRVRFRMHRGSEICHIVVERSPSPVYVTIPDSARTMRRTEGKQFIVRTPSGNQHMDVEESQGYLREHWDLK